MIKPVEEIPMTAREKKASARERLDKDLIEAIDNKITKFEIEGDYNYKYLAQYAKESLKHIFYRRIVEWQRKWQKENAPNEYMFPKHDGDQFFKVTNYKGPVRNRVYVELFLDGFEEEMEKRCKDALEYHRRMEKEREEKRKERLKKASE